MGYLSSMTPSRSLPGCALLSLFVFFCLCLEVTSAYAADSNSEQVQFDRAEVAKILDNLPENLTSSERITRISGHFLNTPYKENTLVGGASTPERLIADLASFDCFTLLDVVEALRRSEVTDDFIPQLIKVRYKNAVVSYPNRRHFFSDWVSTGGGVIVDVTELVGQGASVHTLKILNKRTCDTPWLDGVPFTERRVDYLPSGEVTEEILQQLRDGDYVGIYTDQAGLDVQHTGVIVKRGNRVLLRHASSSWQSRAVVDDDLINYLRDKKGLVVYRVRTGK